MANVKLSNKEELDKLQARIVLLYGEKITQQKLLDKCITYSSNNFDKFLNAEFNTNKPTKELISRIKNSTFGSGYAHPELTDDELLYGR